ncbi:hypothetical protein [Cryobacterium sp. Y62]|uniref:hypothetical protein n=1 Tax=Cryobacterium sp. Y62 TaxID=2048284 RepID=UPI000CE4CF3A|nr:hypothetical protein [Cryobacterium sp. Y62]
MKSDTGHFPWEWTIGDVDDAFSHARSVQNLSQSKVRAYQTAVKVFCDFLLNPNYDWNELRGRTFGSSLSQVVTEFNRARHVQRNKQQPQKRSFTRRELQDFFDLATLEVERVVDSHRKGAVTAYRDAVAFKTAYVWGCARTRPRICRSSIFLGTRTLHSSAISGYRRCALESHRRAPRPSVVRC